MLWFLPRRCLFMLSCLIIIPTLIFKITKYVEYASFYQIPCMNRNTEIGKSIQQKTVLLNHSLHKQQWWYNYPLNFLFLSKFSRSSTVNWYVFSHYLGSHIWTLDQSNHALCCHPMGQRMHEGKRQQDAGSTAVWVVARGIGSVYVHLAERYLALSLGCQGRNVLIRARTAVER